MGNVTPNLTGKFKENSGRMWVSTHNGNYFTWTQEGTGRVATGIVTPINNGTEWVIHITFDGTTHWKLRPSSDGNTLYGPNNQDTFQRVANNYSIYTTSGYPISSSIVDVPNMIGQYQENSGKTWNCTYYSSGHYKLQNTQDNRLADGYISKDPSTGKYTSFINFHNPSGDHLLRIDTYDPNTLNLSNGDVFRKISTNTSTFMPTPTYVPPPTYTPTVPSYTPTYVPPPTNTSIYIQPTVPVIQPTMPIIQPNLPPSGGMYPNLNSSIYVQPTAPPMVPQNTMNTKTKYRIGGGNDGTTTWTIWNGKPCSTTVRGWGVEFDVDAFGNISGHNKNDVGPAITKHYSGTLINGQLNCYVKWEDGRTAIYSGMLPQVNGGRVRFNFTITSVGTQGGYVNDCGVNEGTAYFNVLYN
ncbi:hypothetical protein ABK040_008764 [Willaertia magna]